MNNKSLDTVRNYVEFNAKESPKLNFISCPHTNKTISNEELKINLDKINFYLVNKKKQKKVQLFVLLLKIH